MTRDGDHPEFTRSTAGIRSRLPGQAFRLCGDWHEADDLVQETLVLVFRAWPRLTERGALDGYVRRVLTRRFTSTRRSPRWRREVLLGDTAEWLAVTLGDSSTENGFVECLGALPPRQRAVLLLRYWEDLSVEQTAAVLHVSPGTVASQAHKAIRTLRRSLRVHDRPSSSGASTGEEARSPVPSPHPRISAAGGGEGAPRTEGRGFRHRPHERSASSKPNGARRIRNSDRREARTGVQCPGESE